MSDINALRASVSIVDLIERSGLHVIGHGKHLTTKEHDSLRIFPETNSWYWFSRGEGGDVFTWLEKHGRMTFTEACQAIERGEYGRVSLPVVAREPKPVPQLAQDLHLRYYRNLDDAARAWWRGQGINDAAMARFFLGYCEFHPIYRQPTYTISIIENGRLLNVRHRLACPQNPKDKYRPEQAGIPAALFNADILTPELAGVVVVAGEKKVVVLWQHGIPAVSSTAGCGHWPVEFTTRLQFCQKVYIAFDPGESAAAWRMAEHVGERAFIVSLPDKPDDFITAHGEQAFRQHLRDAEPYADRGYWQRQLGGKSPWGKLLP